MPPTFGRSVAPVTLGQDMCESVCVLKRRGGREAEREDYCRTAIRIPGNRYVSRHEAVGPGAAGAEEPETAMLTHVSCTSVSRMSRLSPPVRETTSRDVYKTGFLASEETLLPRVLPIAPRFASERRAHRWTRRDRAVRPTSHLCLVSFDAKQTFLRCPHHWKGNE